MKRALLFLFLAGISSLVFLFSDESDGPWLSESWLSLGYEHGIFFEKSFDGKNNVEAYTSSPGISFGGYRFFDGMNIGIFVDSFFGFPKDDIIKTNGISRRHNSDYYFFNMQVGMIIGPGFRIPLGEYLDIKFAIGTGFLLSTALYTESNFWIRDGEYSRQTVSFGLGGDMGVKINITEKYFISSGAIFTYDFIGYFLTDTPFNNSSGWFTDYTMIGIRPYLAIGMNLFWRYN